MSVSLYVLAFYIHVASSKLGGTFKAAFMWHYLSIEVCHWGKVPEGVCWILTTVYLFSKPKRGSFLVKSDLAEMF